MEQLKKYLKQYRFLLLALLLLFVCLAFLYFRLLPFGWYSFRYTWYKIIVFVLFFAVVITYLLKKEPLFTVYIVWIHGLVKKYLPKIAVFSVELFVFLFIIVLTIPGIARRPQLKNITIYNPTNTSSSATTPTPLPKVSFNDGQHYGSIWVGSMSTADRTSSTTMHVTYTVEFSYNVLDQSRKAVKVEVTDIAHTTKLPGKGAIYILPYSHLKRSENGGALISTQIFEDWNTFGYYNASDYTHMKSLGTTYTPVICDTNFSCDYNDQVGKQAGYMGLRFKHLGIATTNEINYSADVNTLSRVFGVSKDEMDATISWKLKITLDDGSVYERTYHVTLPGNNFSSSTNTSELVKF